jgi:hypothetical protein
MDNFMEQPTYRMNRGGILTQGWRGLVHGMNEGGKSKKIAACASSETSDCDFFSVVHGK